MPDLQAVLQQLSVGRARLEALSGAPTIPDQADLIAEITHLSEELLVADEELRVQDEELSEVRRRLETATSRWEQAFAVSPTPYLVTDVNGIVVNTNRAARAALGEPPGSTRVRPIASKFVLADRPAIRSALRAARESGSAELTARMLHADASEHPVRVSVVTLDLRDEPQELLWWQLSAQHRRTSAAGATLTALSAAVADAEDVKTVADRAAGVICEHVPELEWVLVYLRKDSGTGAVLAAASGAEAAAPPLLDMGLASAPLGRESGAQTGAGAAGPALQVLALAVDDSPPEGLLVVGARSPWEEDTQQLLRAAATTVAAQLAVVRRLAAERDRVANLNVALDTNRRIGAALGILMAQRKLTDAQAFDVLRSASQRRHIKLRELADEVVLTGELPYSPLDSPRVERPPFSS